MLLMYGNSANSDADHHADKTDLSSPSPMMTTSFRKDATNYTGIKCSADEAPNKGLHKSELALLDMYAGCGGMSTGLCFGAKASGINLVTVTLINSLFSLLNVLCYSLHANVCQLTLTLKRWAVDMDEAACESLRFNHSDTQVGFSFLSF